MKIRKNLKPITAAEFDDTPFADTIDDLADSVEDMQDTIEEIDEDDVDIEIDDDIANHYIAKCDSCHYLFISAMVETDQDVKSVTGICPNCQKETEQLLKWVIHER